MSARSVTERRQRAVAAAAGLAVATTSVTGVAHAIGGGQAPSALLVAAAAVATLVVAAPALGSSPGGLRTGIAVAAAQLVQHLVYSVPHGSASTAGHAHGTVVADAGAAVHAPMPLAHLGAGIVVLAALRLAPILARRAVDATRPRLAARLLLGPPALPERTPAVAAAAPAPVRPHAARIAVVPLRGPPAAVA